MSLRDALFDDPFAPSPSQTAASTGPSVDGVVLSPADAAAFAKVFKLADVQGTGIVSPQVAVGFFSKSRLPQETLSAIWNLSVSEHSGSLVQPAFFKALKLIAAAQAGLPVAASSLSQKTPLPVFEGITLDPSTPAPAAAPLQVQLTGNAARLQVHRTGDSIGFGASASSLPLPTPSMSVSQEDKDRFTSFFNAAKPVNGLITGEVARDMFLKSNLPLETLGKIWTLVDSTGSGKLSLNQFIIAMFLITKIRLNQLPTVPSAIPQDLWNSVSGVSASAASTSPSVATSPGASRRNTNASGFWDTHQHVMSGSPSAGKSLGISTLAGNALSSRAELDMLAPLSPGRPKQDTSSLGMQQASFGALSTDSLAPSLSDDDRKQYFGFFDKLDAQKKGYLTGEESYSFFLKSKLATADLAQIWDLVDTTKTGRISRDAFATAMGLIKTRMTGAALPTTLTPSASLLNTQPSIFDAVPSSSTVSRPALVAEPADPFANSAFGAPLLPTPTIAPKLTNDLTGSKLPGSPFGPDRANSTGMLAGLGGSGFSLPQIPVGVSQYQEVAEREADLNVRKEEVKRLTEQLNLLHPTAEELKKKRADIDAEFKSVTEEKNKLSIQISTIRATYETEVQIVRDTQNQLMAEIQRLESSRMELRQIEEAVNVVKTEKTSLTEQNQRFQHETSEAKKKIQEFTDESNQMRTELEKVRAESRQLMQLLDVNQKLLSSAQLENQQVKMDLAQEMERLEYARTKSAQLHQQASVQQAINQKEREKIRAAETSRAREVARSQELLTSLASASATSSPTASAPIETAKSMSALDAGNDAAFALPSGAPPPLPPSSSKPVKVGESTASIPPGLLAEASTRSVSVDILAIPAAPTSAVTASGPSSPVKPELTKKLSRDELNAKDKTELDELFATNRPKTPVAGGSLSPTKSISSMRSEPMARTDAPVASATSIVAPVAATSAPASTTTAVPAAKFDAGFDAGFANAFAAPSPATASSIVPDFASAFPASATTASPAGAPRPPTTPSSQSSVARKVSGANPAFDIDAEMAKAFTVDKAAHGARDSNTIHSTASSALDPAFSKPKPNDFSADAFTFDASFAEPKAVRPATPAATSAASKSEFDAVFSTAFAPPTLASTPAPAFKAGDFDSAFGSDPFGAATAAPASASGAMPPASGADLDSAFGFPAFAAPAASSSASKPATADPFGSVDFASAFGTPATTSSPQQGTLPRAASPTRGADAPEVETLTNMGFSKEQALNALEIHDFDVDKAINYLIGSA